MPVFAVQPCGEAQAGIHLEDLGIGRVIYHGPFIQIDQLPSNFNATVAEGLDEETEDDNIELTIFDLPSLLRSIFFDIDGSVRLYLSVKDVEDLANTIKTHTGILSEEMIEILFNIWKEIRTKHRWQSFSAQIGYQFSPGVFLWVLEHLLVNQRLEIIQSFFRKIQELHNQLSRNYDCSLNREGLMTHGLFDQNWPLAIIYDWLFQGRICMGTYQMSFSGCILNLPSIQINTDYTQIIDQLNAFITQINNASNADANRDSSGTLAANQEQYLFLLKLLEELKKRYEDLFEINPVINIKRASN